MGFSVTCGVRWRLTVRGIVQGVGFRPFVYQIAQANALAGWVCNTGDGVTIEVEGDEAAVRTFLQRLQHDAPPLARITALETTPIPLEGEQQFTIRASGMRHAARAGIPPDVATCADCLADIADPANRRVGYPFTNCTNCGPRFTIIRAVPYDRPQTTMREFAMCPVCRAEYENPGDRRFHAQPNACPVCGPHLALDGQGGDDAACIAQAAALLRAGKILAIKGLGGYHLACDARHADAVQALRSRKGRAGKPFALMCSSVAAARMLCDIDADAEALLTAPERPIVLLPIRADAAIASAVAPGMRTLGIMLTYTPLHHLLLEACGGPLVMTSGNLSDEPIAYVDDEAHTRLGRLADHFLTHDRPIHLACDDSLARVAAGIPMILRRARGYVPRTVTLPGEGDLPPVLAAGGDLKNTFCLLRGREALLSQHLGDLENPVSLEHYARMVEHFSAFFAVTPQIVAHDLHPEYHATRLAKAWPGVVQIGVQHHHAHIAACMAEHQLTGPVIGVAYDGTGYGTDGAIWGGEILLADYDGFTRAAHLREVALPGGDAAIRRPSRMALAHLLALGLSVEEASADLPDLTAQEAAIIAAQIARGVNAPRTTSMGRLFDAVSALLGVCRTVTYEGQAAIELEVAAGLPARRYPFAFDETADGVVMDTRPLLAALRDDKRAGVQVVEIAATFHATIAAMTAASCVRIRAASGIAQVALGGGVFQNVTLLEEVCALLHAERFAVYWPQQIPCNDGGLALGQAVIAARRTNALCV